MNKALKSRLFLIVPLIVLVIALRFSMNRSDPRSDDEQIKTLLARPGAVEARSWLETAPDGSRFVGGDEQEYNHTKATSLVRELYQRGAVQVTAVSVVTDRDEAGKEVQYTDTLIVELPDEPKSRKLLFDLDASEVQEEYGPAVDQGQRYFMMWWD